MKHRLMALLAGASAVALCTPCAMALSVDEFTPPQAEPSIGLALGLAALFLVAIAVPAFKGAPLSKRRPA